LPLAGGGTVAAGEFGHDALVGDSDWLPDIRPGGLIGLRIRGGQLAVEAIGEGVAATVEHERVVRAALSRHIREERWWSSDLGEPNRGAEFTRALARALLEDPHLLSVPTTPLIELLYDVLSEQSGHHLLDDSAAWDADEVVSFGIAGMPQSLHGELSRRPSKYGLSVDRYVVLALGHLARRTPFAEDLGPWEDWTVPELAGNRAALRAVKGMDDDD
jgi:hypothetical protein